MGEVIFLLFVVWGVAVSLFDATTRRIPNALSLPAVVLTWAFCAVSPWWSAPFAAGHFDVRSLAGGAAWWLLVVSMGVVLGTRARAGAGDAKLAASLGVLVVASGSGAVGWFLAVGGAGALGTLTAWLSKQRTEVPQGPAMVGATTAVVLCNYAMRAL